MTHPEELNRQGPSLVMIGTDFRRASLDLREKVSYSQEQAAEALVHLLARPEVAEACLVSTCNRTEVYLHPLDEESALRTALDLTFLSRVPEIEKQGRLTIKWHGDAAHHLLAVASGLESMVLGEPEILGQVKQASQLAEVVGASGTVLRRLLRSAIKSGQRARQETGISEGAVSFGYAVIELAKHIFSRLEQHKVLLLGAGEIAEQVARNLQDRQDESGGQLLIANRSRERAESFLERYPEARIVDFVDRAAVLSEVDLVVASTGADEPILTREQVAAVMARRRRRPLLIVDLGVPRNVEGTVRQLSNVFLHDIDSLEHLIEHNLRRRRDEVPRVQQIVGEELARFHDWYRGLEVEPVIAGLQKQAEAIRRREVAGALAHFPEESHEALEQLTRALVRKILHHPSRHLRRAEDLNRLDLVRELFRLDGEEEA